MFLIIISTISISCQSIETKNEIKIDTNLVILDVRTPQELIGKLGHIPGVINIPVQVLSKRITDLDEYKNKDIAVIYRTGHRSSIAAKMLIAKGFKVMNVLGGMTAYNKL